MKVVCNNCGKKNKVTTSGLNQRGVTRETYLCRGCASRIYAKTRKFRPDLSMLKKIERFANVYQRLKRRRKVN
jgi:uncharacterized protein YlaI